MDTNENQIQKISPTLLVAKGCKSHSIELMKCYLTKNKIDLSIKKKEIMVGGKPNFDVIFQSGKSTAMVTLKKAIGMEAMLKLLVVMLEDLVNYFNVQRPMNEDQITDLAVEILEEMRDITFEEIVAFIEGIKREEYGKIYERFDAPTFWKFYWGESPDDKNSYNYKKMNYCLADARKDVHIEFKQEPTELEELLTKPRKSRESIENFLEKIGNYPTEPPKK